MNTRKVRSKFNNFQILLDSGCNSTIVMNRLIEKLNAKRGDVMQWHTQAGNINTDLKVKLHFTLPKLRAMKIVTRNCHVYDSDKVRYVMILGRDSLTGLVLNLGLSEHVIEADDGPLKGLTAPMIYVGMYELKNLNTGKNTPEEMFMNYYKE